MRRLIGLAALALLASGCAPEASPEKEWDMDVPPDGPIEEPVIVSAWTDNRLRACVYLRAETLQACCNGIDVATSYRPGRVRILVQGVTGHHPLAPLCDCMPGYPLEATILLPRARSRVTMVDVEHRGQTDLYRYTSDPRGNVLEAVRTHTTRLGPGQVSQDTLFAQPEPPVASGGIVGIGPVQIDSVRNTGSTKAP